MRVTILGINYKFNNGYDQDYTGVELQYLTTGFKIGDNNPIEITKQQYEDNKANPNGLRALIVAKKIDEADAYMNDLNDYKATLQGE